MKGLSNFHPELVKHQASGGFKLHLATLLKHSKVPQHTALFQKETQNPKEILTKTDLLNQVGLDPNVKEFSMDFEEMQEEGVYGMKSKREIADYVIKDLEKKIEKRKIARKELAEKFLEQRLQKESQALPEDVIIYEGDQRKQYASHILSTLEVHSVENLEALIVSFILIYFCILRGFFCYSKPIIRNYFHWNLNIFPIKSPKINIK